MARSLIALPVQNLSWLGQHISVRLRDKSDHIEGANTEDLRC